MKLLDIVENEEVKPLENDKRWEIYAEDPNKKYVCYHIPRFKAKPNEARFKHVLDGVVIISSSKTYPSEFKNKMNS